jgi:isoquinoline 1-oxidoreductase subunit beta
MTTISKLDRRDFLKLGAVAGGGLFLGVYFPDVARRPDGRARTAGPLQPNAFVRIDTDGTVTIWSARSDMGQGVRTAMPMIVAEELDADWSKVRILQADADPRKYGRMMTVGSSSVRGDAWMALRQAGATARQMLVAAAAAKWGVSASDCRTENGRVFHDGSKRSVGYGEVADSASTMTVPSQPQLKDPKEFKVIGKRIPLVDTKEKVSGRAAYGIDARVPGMLFATVVHPPVFGDSVRSFDDTTTRAVPGVRQVVQVSQGVAVVAENTWAAIKGARALSVQWQSGGFAMSSDEIFSNLAQLVQQPGTPARSEGNVDSALSGAAHRIDATYQAPYLAHATMEPMNCTADVRADRCEIWAPTQNPQGTQSAAAQITGLPIDKVTVHVPYLGCGWGRRSRTDFVEDAVETSKKIGAPVQVLWTREEDMQHDQYRPAAHVEFQGGVDAQGKVVALRVRVATPPISGGRGGVDGPAVDAISNTPYAIPNLHVDYSKPDIAVPVGYWRSVGPSQNAFFIESFMDELAHAANRDPLDVRLELLSGAPRMKHVLEVAAQRSNWKTPAPAGRARGLAIAELDGSFVAEVAEVSVQNNRVRVHKVWCVADCGRVMHPGIVEAQLMGAIIGGLTAALYGEITIESGRVKQANFNDYRMVRINEAPEYDIFLVDSEEEPGGAGEPGVPQIGPAVANAIFRLTGTRVRRLPIRLEPQATIGGKGGK